MHKPLSGITFVILIRFHAIHALELYFDVMKFRGILRTVATKLRKYILYMNY